METNELQAILERHVHEIHMIPGVVGSAVGTEGIQLFVVWGWGDGKDALERVRKEAEKFLEGAPLEVLASSVPEAL